MEFKNFKKQDFTVSSSFKAQTQNLGKEVPKDTLNAMCYNSSAPDIPLAVMLNGIWVGNNNNQENHSRWNGEFYWNTVVADGDHVWLNDSNKCTGGNGFYRNQAGSWLNLSRTPIYSSTSAPTKGTFSIGLRLMKNENYSESKAVFNHLGEMTQSAVNAYVGTPYSGPITNGVVSLVNNIISPDNENIAINCTRGFYGAVDHYHVGRFFSMTEQGGSNSNCAAVMSVVPFGDHGDKFNYNYCTINGVGDRQEVQVNHDGQFSLFCRRPWHNNVPNATISLIQDGEVKHSWEFTRWVRNTVRVNPGKYCLEVSSPGGAPCELDTIYTAFGKNLAKDTWV
jgi:hypothetical protein